MSVMKQGMDAMAAKHIADGGSCRTVILSGVSVDICIDGNGDVMNLPAAPKSIGFVTVDRPSALREMIKLTGQ